MFSPNMRENQKSYGKEFFAFAKLVERRAPFSNHRERINDKTIGILTAYAFSSAALLAQAFRDIETLQVVDKGAKR